MEQLFLSPPQLLNFEIQYKNFSQYYWFYVAKMELSL